MPDRHAAGLEQRRPCAPPGVLAGAAVREADACRGSSIVWRIPSRPGIADVVVGERDPVEAGVDEARRCGPGWPRRPVPWRGSAKPVGRRVLEVGDREVGARDEVADDAGVAGPLRVRQVPADRRAVLAAAGDLDGAAVEREVGAAPASLIASAHAAVEQDVAAGEQRPGRRRGRSAGRLGGRAGAPSSGHFARLLTRSAPNRLLPPHASARTDGPTSSARRNAERACGSSPGSPRAVRASATVTSRLPRSARSSPSSARIASASASTRTSALNGDVPVGERLDVRRLGPTCGPSGSG